MLQVSLCYSMAVCFVASKAKSFNIAHVMCINCILHVSTTHKPIFHTAIFYAQVFVSIVEKFATRFKIGSCNQWIKVGFKQLT